MSEKWNKDAWIKKAIEIGYLIPREDGTVLRRKHISTDGRTMSRETVPVKPRTHKKTGRVFFDMTFLGIKKSVLLNRVIALAFLPNPLNLPQVNHIDGDKAHNYLKQPTPALRAKWGEYQLEWSTAEDNERHAHQTGLKSGRGSQNSNAKLTADDVLAIRASQASDVELAEQYGVSRSTIIHIRKRKTWKHL